MKASIVLASNLQAAMGDLLRGVIEERGRGFASDKEAWADLKEHIETGKKMVGDAEKIHKDMWDAVKENNPDAFGILGNEIERNAMQQAAVWLMIATLAKLSYVEVTVEGDE